MKCCFGRVILGGFFGIVLICLAAAVYFLSSASGARCLVSWTMRAVVPQVSLEAGRWSGAIARQVTLHGARLSGRSGILPGYEMRVQKADLYFSQPSCRGLNIEFQNARWRMPHSDPAVIDGVYQEGVLEARLFASRLELSDLIAFFPPNTFPRGARGRLRDVDLKIEGSLRALHVQGGFKIEVFESRQAYVKEAAGRLDVRLFRDGRVEGTVTFARGVIVLPRTDIHLLQARVRFDGDPRRPSYEGFGEAVVAGIHITLSCEGIGDQPKLRLSSDPPMPEEKLWLMLGTGRGWQGAEAALEQGRLSPDVVGDFLDTFVLGGLGGRLAEQWGVRNVSLTYNERERGFDVTKSLTDHVGVLYGRREPVPQPGNTTLAVPVTDRIVVEYKKRF